MDRTELTAGEREAVGQPGDLVDEERVPARPRSASVMFSLRIDRATFERLSDLAEERGRRFSEVAREALRMYVEPKSESPSSRDLLEAIADKLGVVAPPEGSSSARPSSPRRRARPATPSGPKP